MGGGYVALPLFCFVSELQVVTYGIALATVAANVQQSIHVCLNRKLLTHGGLALAVFNVEFSFLVKYAECCFLKLATVGIRLSLLSYSLTKRQQARQALLNILI
jgi:hypothetical protein